MTTHHKTTIRKMLRPLDVELELVVSDQDAEVTEGAVWDERAERLLWVDITAGRINSLTPATSERKRWQLPHEVGAVAPREAGGLIAADRFGFVLLSDSPADEPIRLRRVAGSGLRMNDGACDPGGAFWAGSMAFDEAPGAGTLYRLSPDGTVDEMLRGVTVSNGIGWTCDGRRMYYVDTATNGIDLFEFQPGQPLGARRRIADLSEEPGGPDGLTVDSEDCAWVGIWNGWCVRRYSPDGDLLAEIRLPAAQVTSCAFGGADFDRLYITTAAHLLTDAERAAQPLAGSIFCCRPAVSGFAGFRYAG